VLPPRDGVGAGRGRHVGYDDPAVITVSARSAQLRGSGDERRLTLEAVAPTIATFDAEASEASPVSTWSVIDSLPLTGQRPSRPASTCSSIHS
jgi:hypothetical protein